MSDFMFTFDGFTTLGEITLDQPDYDMDRFVVVLGHDETGTLFSLDLTGCPCCGDIYDDVKVTDAEAVPGLLELAQRLVEDWSELRDEFVRDEAEKDIRVAVRAAAAWVGVGEFRLPLGD